jgi:hypothetical protein
MSYAVSLGAEQFLETDKNSIKIFCLPVSYKKT